MSILADWANEQDNWVRALVGEILSIRKELPSERVELYYRMLLVEKELEAGEKSLVPDLRVDPDAPQAEEALTLLGVKNVQNVNALTPGQGFQFNKRMTVFFGENGTGKTGYVRILKRVAGVRAAETILPDIRKAKPVAKPQATITYFERDEKSIDWRDEHGVAPLTRIDVFDARDTAIHVDEELTYVFTPAELSVFRLVALALEAVKARLERARSESEPSGNPYTARFVRGSVVFPKIESLGPATDLSDLVALAAVSEAEESQLESLRERVEALRSSKTVQLNLQLARADRDTLQRARRALGTLQAFDRRGYQAAVETLTSLQGKQAKSTSKIFDKKKDGIPGLLDRAWLEFVDAGDRYLREVEKGDYPARGAPCLYCRQPLEEAAVALIRRYREFCGEGSRAEIEAARRSIQALAKPVLDLDLKGLEDAVSKRIESFGKGERPTIWPALATFCGALRGVQEALTSSAPLRDDTHRAPADLDVLLTDELGKADAVIGDLGKQEEDRKKSLEIEAAKLRDLEARLLLHTLLPEIQTHVARLKWASRAATVVGRFRGIAQSLTKATKEASEGLMNNNFVARFEEECRLLAAPEVKLDFPGRKGQPARRKTLSPDYKLSAVLSEGEQKALALADFIAEALLRNKPSPIVFDDPVNSLDYKRLEHVVDRLVELSNSRQVIVFTHNILLAVSILARFEDSAGECSYYDIGTIENARGIVTRGTHPRADTFNSLKARLNSTIQECGRAQGEVQQALIEKGFELLRSICEVVVEKDLLQEVTQRYQPNVMMTKLPKIRADRLPAAITAITPIFERACRFIASHSQPIETLNVRPTLKDLTDDWAKIQAARDAYNAKG